MIRVRFNFGKASKVSIFNRKLETIAFQLDAKTANKAFFKLALRCLIRSSILKKLFWNLYYTITISKSPLFLNKKLSYTPLIT